MAVLKTTQETFEADVLQNKGIVYVDFFADWCGPCRMSAPIIEELSQSDAYKDITFMKLDVDASTELATKLNVFSIPTFIAFYKGEPIVRSTGGGPAERFKKDLDEALAKASQPAN